MLKGQRSNFFKPGDKETERHPETPRTHTKRSRKHLRSRPRPPSTSFPSSTPHFLSLEVVEFCIRSTKVLPSPKWLRRPPHTQEARRSVCSEGRATDLAAASCVGAPARGPHRQGTGLLARDGTPAAALPSVGILTPAVHHVKCFRKRM